MSTRYKHQHSHRHQHAHKHEHKHRRTIPQAILASELAEKPMHECLGELETLARELNLYDVLFHFGTQKPLTSNAFSEAENRLGTTEPDPLEMEDLLQLSSHLKQKVMGLGLELDKVQQHRLIRLIDHLCLPDSDDKRSLDEQVYRENFGSIACPSLSGITDVDDQLREVLASRLFPIGMGWKNIYEYRYYLACYFYNVVTSPVVKTSTDHGTLAAQLKAKYEKRLGQDKAQALWQAFEALVTAQLTAIREGKEQRGRRSPTQVAKLCGCNLEIARELILLIPLLPRTPLEDYQGTQFPEKKRRVIKRLNKPEGKIEWDEVMEEYIFTWSEDMASRIKAYTSNTIQKHIEIIRSLNKKNVGATPTNQSLRDEIESLDFSVDKNVLEDLTARWLSAHKENMLDRVQKLISHSDAFREAAELKPAIVEYIVNYQKEALISGQNELLQPLSKADVVRAFGYLPSSSLRDKKISNDKQLRKKANMGRRLERYMKNMRVVLQDSRTISLEELIPGLPSVADSTGRSLTKAAVVQYIREVIDSEDKNIALSDQKISDVLRAEYGIKIARKTVYKHRALAGIPSSQERKI